MGRGKKRMWEDTPIFSQGKAIGALFFPADVCVDFSITTRQQQPEQEKHSRLGLKEAIGQLLPASHRLTLRHTWKQDRAALGHAACPVNIQALREGGGMRVFSLTSRNTVWEGKTSTVLQEGLSRDTLSSTQSVCRDANKGMTFQAHLYLSCRM